MVLSYFSRYKLIKKKILLFDINFTKQVVHEFLSIFLSLVVSLFISTIL